jgi:hypothetical protein
MLEHELVMEGDELRCPRHVKRAITMSFHCARSQCGTVISGL